MSATYQDQKTGHVDNVEHSPPIRVEFPRTTRHGNELASLSCLDLLLEDLPELSRSEVEAGGDDGEQAEGNDLEGNSNKGNVSTLL